MKQLLLPLALLPLLAAAQTTERRLTMTLHRTIGSTITAILPTEADETGPIFDFEENKLHIKTYAIDRKRIKEIRFKVEEVEVPDGIEGIPMAEGDMQNAPVYDLSGRRHNAGEALPKGIYIIGNKKYVKK